MPPWASEAEPEAIVFHLPVMPLTSALEGVRYAAMVAEIAVVAGTPRQ